MIKVGFICEGDTEKELLSSQPFTEYLSSLGLQCVNVVNAAGADNLLPHNITSYYSILQKQNVEKVIILADLDNNTCITATKQRIGAQPNEIIVIAVRQIESWFLADTESMRKLLTNENYITEYPELEQQPFEKINALAVTFTGRGFGKKKMRGPKKKLARKIIENGFSFTNAALHNNCPSAKYFINKLTQMSKV